MNPEKVKRVVIKLGTNTVMGDNKFNFSLIDDLARDISTLVRVGKQFMLVSSGAIGLGLEKTHLHNSPRPVEMQQALAAVGQSHLMHCYGTAFEKYNQLIAQVLLAQDNFDDKKSLKNLKNTLDKLLSLNIVPVINENDAVAVEELARKRYFSDNDMLAAKLAVNLDADLLIMVSTVGGLFTANPETDSKASLIKRVRDLSKTAAVVNGKSSAGRGGFETKLQAADIALNNKIPLIITKGGNGLLAKIFKGEISGTLFER